MHHLLYCYRSRLDWCLKKLQKYLPTQNLPAVCQKQTFQNKKNAKNVFLTDRLQFFWLCNRKQRPYFFRPDGRVDIYRDYDIKPLMSLE